MGDTIERAMLLTTQGWIAPVISPLARQAPARCGKVPPRGRFFSRLAMALRAARRRCQPKTGFTAIAGSTRGGPFARCGVK